jgi:hypothetical protein
MFDEMSLWEKMFAVIYALMLAILGCSLFIYFLLNYI